MLTGLRKAVKSWLAVVLLGLLVVAVVATGFLTGGDPFGGPGKGVLAKVGNADVSLADFDRRFDQVFRRELSENPDTTRADLIRQGLDTGLVEFMVSVAALDGYAGELGLTTAPQLIADQIRNNPAFQFAGQFDQTRYLTLLQENRLTPELYERELSSELTREQLSGVIESTSSAPSKVVDAYVQLLAEARTATIAAVPLGFFVEGLTPPDEDEVKAFYDANIERYQTREVRDFSYVLLTAASLSSDLEISEEEIAAAYEANLADYGGVETRNLQQVIAPDKATADAILAAVEQGKTFAQVASEFASLTEEDIALGDVTQEAVEADAGKAIAEAAFAASQGDIVGPVNSSLGQYLIAVTAISPASPTPLDDVRDELREKLTQDKATSRVYEVSEQLDDRLASGASLDEAAQELGLTVSQIAGVAADGGDAIGNPGTLDETQTALVLQAFQQGRDEQPLLREIGPSEYAALQISDVRVATARPLDEVRPQVLAQWTVTELDRRASKMAEDLIASVKAGNALDAAVSQAGLPKTETVSVRRVQLRTPEGVPEAIRLMFSLPQGELGQVPGSEGRARFVVQVTEVTPGSADDLPGVRERVAAEMSAVAGRELSAGFALAVREEMGVRYNSRALEQRRQQILEAGQ